MADSHIDSHGEGAGESASDTLNDASTDDVLVADLRAAFDLDPQSASAGDLDSLAFLGPKRAPPDIPATREALSAGRVLADFEIVREIGRGGMGIVYEARQLSLNREVALKVLPDYARHGRTAVKRFRNEALAAARLNHTNVVPIYAQGEYEGHYFYAMKLINGVSLDRVIRAHPEFLSSTHVGRTSGSVSPPLDFSVFNEFEGPEETDDGVSSHSFSAIKRTEDDYRYLASLVAGVADGLAHAHANGVIHRDIKPHNLLLGPDRHLHITDFGLAHLTSEPHITLTGEVMGTPLYLAPEQARGEVSQIDERTDVYALGVTLYELITGSRAFDAANREMVLEAVRYAIPMRPRQVDSRVPLDLETICLRAIEKRATDRYKSAAEVSEDLRRFADGRPILSKRVTLLERGIKWVRRHKGISYGVAVTGALLAVTVTLASSISARRHQEAMNLADGVYRKLVHYNYKRPDLVEADLSDALSRGASGGVADLARAMVCLGKQDQESAISILTEFIDREPKNMDARYMLAWAYSRYNKDLDLRLTRAVREEADALGGPDSPESFFLRALSVHHEDAGKAIDDYRTAMALMDARQEFFPQASVNLARGRNQRMYKDRDIDGFSEAERTLKELIDNGQYNSYPYYLLSITYRLAAEIKGRSDDERDQQKAGKFLEEALSYAKKGQAAYPDSESVLRAEAEALEYLGEYDTAIHVRSRIIEMGPKLPRCESVHYRWRLRHWTGDLEGALADIELHASDCQTDAFYEYVFSAVVAMEQGRDQDAYELVDSILSDEALGWRRELFAAEALYLLGDPDEAQVVLERGLSREGFSDLAGDESGTWIQSLYQYSTDQIEFGILSELARGTPQERDRLAEASFLAGVKALASGNRVLALDGFDRSHQWFDSAFGYSFRAQWLLNKISMDPAWPAWISHDGGRHD